MLLRTRGLLAVSIPRPPRQQETGIKWFTAPPDPTRNDLCWYTDGSMKFGPTWELRRTGCSIVAVSHSCDLVAFGNACPAPWVRTAVAAELWAVMLVLAYCVEAPCIVTDCLSILVAATGGSVQVTAPNRPLAELWSRIATYLEDDVSLLCTNGHLVWMPAHGTAATIGNAHRSDGNTVSTVDWRANRLADALAKAAIGKALECAAAARLVERAEELVRHECAVLGAVTHAANHHVIQVIEDGRQQRSKVVRDSTGVKRSGLKTTRGISKCAVAAATIATGESRQCLFEPMPRHIRVAERASSRRAATAARKASGEASITAILDASAAKQRSSSEPPAQGRFDALRARILARTVGSLL